MIRSVLNFFKCKPKRIFLLHFSVVRLFLLKPYKSMMLLFLQETINMKVLLPWIAISQSHSESDLAATLEACTSALQLYKIALDTGDPLSMIKGPIVKPVFREYN